MVDDFLMKDRNNCYVKLVCENYYDDHEIIVPQIHLIFKSKKDYDKISDIEKMIKNYFKLEEKFIKSNKKIIYYYLKDMISYLEECEVMEVFSDHVEAFPFGFEYINDFIDNNMILSLPRSSLIFSETYEDFNKQKLENVKEYYKRKYGENGKYYRNIQNVV